MQPYSLDVFIICLLGDGIYPISDICGCLDSDDLLQEDAIESGARRNMTPDGGIGGEGGHVPGPSFSVPSGGVDTSLAIGRTYSTSQGGTSDGTASMRYVPLCCMYVNSIISFRTLIKNLPPEFKQLFYLCTS